MKVLITRAIKLLVEFVPKDIIYHDRMTDLDYLLNKVRAHMAGSVVLIKPALGEYYYVLIEYES